MVSCSTAAARVKYRPRQQYNFTSDLQMMRQFPDRCCFTNNRIYTYHKDDIKVKRVRGNQMHKTERIGYLYQ
jgi:hypothetical protein